MRLFRQIVILIEGIDVQVYLIVAGYSHDINNIGAKVWSSGFRSLLLLPFPLNLYTYHFG